VQDMDVVTKQPAQATNPVMLMVVLVGRGAIRYCGGSVILPFIVHSS